MAPADDAVGMTPRRRIHPLGGNTSPEYAVNQAPAGVIRP